MALPLTRGRSRPPSAQEFRDPAKDASQLSKEQLVERMMMRFIVEALYCLQDGVIRNARDGDVAAVMGIGFPPFRGGPFMYIDKLGADHVVSRLKALEAEHGAQYAPPEILLKHAKDGTPFISSAPERRLEPARRRVLVSAPPGQGVSAYLLSRSARLHAPLHCFRVLLLRCGFCALLEAGGV